jgi:hypothetical protein
MRQLRMQKTNRLSGKKYVYSAHWSMSSLCTNSLFYTLNTFCESLFMRRSGHSSRQIGPNHNAQFLFTVPLYRKPLCIITRKNFNSNKVLYSWSMQIKLNILSRIMCDYRRGLDWLICRFIDHLQVVAINNYNTIVISTFYSSLEHTV